MRRKDASLKNEISELRRQNTNLKGSSMLLAKENEVVKEEKSARVK